MPRSKRVLAILTSTSLFLAACDDSRPTGPAITTPAPDLLPAVCASPMTARLIADGDVAIGTVRIGNDETTLFVTYQVSAQHALGQTRLAVVTSAAELPANGQGNPQPGKFPYATRHRPAVTEFTYAVPLTEIPAAADDRIVVAAFAEVGDDLDGAWSEGPRITESGSWAMYTPYVVQACEPAVDGPTATITAPAGGASVQAGDALAFDGSASLDPAGGGLSYHWDFGDGVMGGGAQIAHVFASAGARTVTLTVTDANGASDAASIAIDVTSPPAPAGAATLHGAITDAAGNPLAGVVVQRAGGQALGITDNDGAIDIANFPTGVAILLKLSLGGYADGFVPVELADLATEGFFSAALRARNPAATLADAATGGTLLGEDGVAIVFPPNALVDGDGNPVSGAVDVALTPIDVSGPELAAFPGRFTGLLPDASSTLIVSFGAAEFAVSQGGAELQLAPGATATIRLPVYMPGVTLGETVPLWSLDEASGIWVQEGTGLVVPGAGAAPVLEAQIAHLSFWNVDKSAAGVNGSIRCKTIQQIFLGLCDYIVTSIGGDWAFRTAGQATTTSNTVLLAPSTLYHVEAFAIDNACILRGSTLLDEPVVDLQEIEVLLQCLTSDGAVRLSYGDLVDAEISASSESDRYVFAGTAGEEIRIDLLSGGLRGFYLLRDPNGDEILSGNFSSGNAAHRFATLGITGDHTIEVTGELADDTGPYSIGLALHVPDPVTALTLPATTGGDLEFPNEIDAFTFTATAGDEVSIAAVRDGTSINQLDGRVTVRSPTNAVVTQDDFSNAVGARALRLPESGTYTVEITATGGLPGAYLLDVRAAASSEIADADDLTGTLTANLEVDAYRFSGTPGDLVRLDFVRTAAGNDVRARVHGPTGLVAGDRVFDEDPPQHLFLTLEAGEYRTSVFSRFNTTGGEYRIAYSVFAPEPSMPIGYGDEVTEEIGFPIETDTWTFDATAGDEVQLTVSTAPGSDLQGNVRLLSPTNLEVASGGYTPALEFGRTTTLTETGQYRIEVSGDASFVPGEYVISLQQQGGPGILPFGQLTQATMDAAGEEDAYTFAGDAGDLVRIHGAIAIGSTLRVSVALEDANGNNVTPIGVIEPNLSYNRTVSLPATGTYTLVLDAIQNAPGGYQIGIGSGVGRRDMTFSGGLVSTGLATTDAFNVRRLRVVANDAVLGVGSEKMRRWLADGSLDATFGVNGVVDMESDAATSTVAGVAIQPDGRIVVAGQSNDDWVVARYSADGVLDPSFGNGGVAIIETGVFTSDLFSGPKDIRLIADGADLDIVLGGRVRVGTGQYRGALARLDPDGTPDAGFAGGAGFVMVNEGGVGEAMEVQSTGRILLVGHALDGVVAAGYLPDGTLDTSFGVNGIATVAASVASVRGSMLRPDDRLIGLGEGGGNALAVGFTADGAADATFGSNGVVSVNFGHFENFREAAVDAAGRIVLTGTMRLQTQSSSGEGEAFVVRLTADGSPDTAFGIGGTAVEDLPDDPHGLALDSQGRIIVGGDRPSGSSSRVGNVIRLLVQ